MVFGNKVWKPRARNSWKRKNQVTINIQEVAEWSFHLSMLISSYCFRAYTSISKVRGQKLRFFSISRRRLHGGCRRENFVFWFSRTQENATLDAFSKNFVFAPQMFFIQQKSGGDMTHPVAWALCFDHRFMETVLNFICCTAKAQNEIFYQLRSKVG